MLRGLEVQPPKTKLRSVMSISKVPTSCFNCAQIHRYNFCLSSSVSTDQHTLCNFGSKPNKARAMISEPRPVQSLATLMDPVSIVFSQAQRHQPKSALDPSFFKSFLGDNWFLSWLSWWTFIFLHIGAFDFSSCQGLHPARLHLMPWLPNSPYFDCRSICVVSHNTYDYQERIRCCFY